MAVPIGADQHALRDKQVADLRAARAHRHEHGDVLGLFHDHHDERDEDVQGGDEHDEADGDEGDQALEAKGMKQGFILVFPIGGHEAFAGGVFELAGDFVGLVDVVDFELEDGDQIAEAEQFLCVGEADEGPTGVVVEETGVENSDHVEAVVFGDHAEGGEFALGAGDEHDGADSGAEVIGHVFAENDGRHGSDALLHSCERVGGVFERSQSEACASETPAARWPLTRAL